MAVGANENVAVVWDVARLQHPQELCRLPHKLAVKGLLFCPWAPGLIATGGGSNDRSLRFWHTASGRLLRHVDTGRQITAVAWSRLYKQLLVTFGYSAVPGHVVAALYLWPGAEVVAHAVSPEPLRALSASVSPDQSKVAVAANDGTVRVYRLWLPAQFALSALVLAARGCYGSALVENAEGIESDMGLR